MNTTIGRGTFAIKLDRQPPYDEAAGASLGRSTSNFPEPRLTRRE